MKKSKQKFIFFYIWVPPPPGPISFGIETQANITGYHLDSRIPNVLRFGSHNMQEVCAKSQNKMTN